ncbi:hypothetical protein L211DRAFT_824182 [Terfezia boudieri ATCC MYA-4762]|uniref:Lanthionine synthetase C-like protein n=1 Tax=Terfezia boudieri ATCC MYA-4762 TaxID=1051890 RepID=A0A3N4LN54_9PEZI|nr:hypothetical protein L211DRAFT_824182 [Terfezia boudieri ATCC MYA-4762]
MATTERYYTSSSLPPPSPPNHYDHLLSSLNHILTTYPPVHFTHRTFSGLYSGPTSISYLILRLSQLHPTLALRGKSCREWSAEYLSPQPLPARGAAGRISAGNCGVASELLVKPVVEACLAADETLAGQVCELEVLINAKSDEAGGGGGSNEWLYGRSGYLYLLRMLRHFFSGPNVRQMVDLAINNTVARIMDDWRAHPDGEGWMWHGKKYLGAAHGVAGIVAQVVMSCRVTGTPIPEELEGIVSGLLDQQLDTGNWPPSKNSSRDDLVQFCHGAPGMLISLIPIKDSFPALRRRIDSACTRGRQVVEQRGLLTKTPSLCHGITGNALAFEDEETLGRFMGYTTREYLERNVGVFRGLGEKELVDEEFGLFTGEGGRAWGFFVGYLVGQGGGDLWGRVVGFNDL